MVTKSYYIGSINSYRINNNNNNYNRSSNNNNYNNITLKWRRRIKLPSVVKVKSRFAF